MDEPNCSTVPVSEPPNEINGEANDDKEESPMEIVKDDESNLARLIINGFDDENEETLLMSVEEVHNYISAKVGTYIRDSNVNPLLVLKNQISVLHDKIKSKSEEFVKLNKLFDALYRDQVKFLRHIGVMPKPETKTVGVSVDQPWLPDSIPGILPESLLKEKSDKVFLPAGTTGANVSSSATRLTKKDQSGPIECIDLTDDVDIPHPPASESTVCTPAPTPATTTADSAENKNTTISSSSTLSSILSQSLLSTSDVKQTPVQHPAPLPCVPPSQGNESEIPPKPRLKISVDKNGIVLQWDLPPEAKNMKIEGFEIVGYQEKSNVPVSSSLWKKIGSVNPMPLPMSCTLTQFVEGHKYHFSIRALAENGKLGHFSDPASIMFVPENKKN